MTPQFPLTLTIAIITIVIPMAIFYYAVRSTPKHGFACTRCNNDLNASAVKCPKCGTPVANSDQLL